jgi:hypothetical protein
MAIFRTFSKKLHWGVKRPPKYRYFDTGHRTCFGLYPICNNLPYQLVPIGHGKYVFKKVTILPIFVWTLPFSAKMPQNATAKKFLRKAGQTDRFHTWHNDGHVGGVQRVAKGFLSPSIVWAWLGFKCENRGFLAFGGRWGLP